MSAVVEQGRPWRRRPHPATPRLRPRRAACRPRPIRRRRPRRRIPRRNLFATVVIQSRLQSSRDRNLTTTVIMLDRDLITTVT